jgi:Spy/CpxP family protein refolding chaperone
VKSNKRKLIVGGLALTILAAVAFSQTVKRVQMHHGDGFFDGHALGFFTDYLNLTADQQAQIKATLEKEKPALKPLMQQQAQAHQELMQMVTSGTFDEAKAQSIANQQAPTMANLMVQRARIGSELFQLLTPDQKTKLTQFIAKHHDGMGHGGMGHDGMDHGGMGPGDQPPSND